MSKSLYEDGAVYQAAITDQMVTRNKNGELQVVFTTRISAKVRDGLSQVDDPEPIEAFERDVFLTLSDDNEKLRMAMDHLDRLGFHEADISKLHPDHSEFVSFVGRQVYVRCRAKGDAAYFNFAWPRWRPAPAGLDETRKTAATLQAKIEEIQRKAGTVAADRRPAGGSFESEPPQVGY